MGTRSSLKQALLIVGMTAVAFPSLNRNPLNGKCFTSKAGKWNNLSQPLEAQRWTESIFA